jgi:tetratricopeptide (TPR) repeat protein
MLTVQILTRNDEATVGAAIESVAGIAPDAVVVGDLGSTDGTRAACRAAGATVVPLGDAPRHDARNRLTAAHGGDVNLWLHPWEAVVAGHAAVRAGGPLDARVLTGTTYTRDLRVWDGAAPFVNPVFERLDAPPGAASGLLIYSRGGPPVDAAMAAVDDWARREPLTSDPLYYKCCLLLGEGRFDDFLKAADHYLFLNRERSVAATMTRYYYALAQLVHRRDHKAALQNANLCLCHRPLMAEFWCLTGDVFYHLLSRFAEAKQFYENALILGARRADDRWPLDVSKYGAYPKKMIESCAAIIGSRGVYVPYSATK